MNRLESWKEIADFFNVSVRTVQGWEVDKALPVQRNPGVRGRVWAEEADLRAWLAAQESAPPPEPARPTRRSPLYFVLVGSLVLIALLTFVALRRPAALSASVKTEGLSLIAFDDQGIELWRHRLPFEHNAAPPAVEKEQLGPTFLDLTGDAKPEVLFPLRGKPELGQNSVMLCLSHNGDLLWQFEPGRAVRTAEVTHAQTYQLRALAPVMLKKHGPPHLAVVSSQSPDFIAQVALLDSGGRLVREYWHSGHFNAVAAQDFDGTGVPEILLAGVSNGYNSATLVVLDPLTMSGASKEPLPKFQILDQGAPAERTRLLLPRTRANLALWNYNVGHGILLAPDHFMVMVRETNGDDCGLTVTYRFSPALDLLAVEPGDSSASCYQSLFAARRLPKLYDPKDELPELRKIRVLTPWH